MAKYSPEQHTKAYELYISSKLTLSEIAKQTGVKKPTLVQWIDQEGWASKKKGIVKAGMTAVDNEFSTFLQNNRLEVAKRQLEQSSQLAKRIYEKYRKRPDGTMPYIKENELLKLSQALKNAAEIEAKAVGLDRPLPNESLGQQKGPLILVGLQATPVKPEPKTVIDVTAREDPF